MILDELIAENQYFALVTSSLSQDLKDYDGVLGLGFNSYLNIIQSLKIQHVIDNAVFTVHIGEDDNDSSFMIGSFDIEKYAENNTLIYIGLSGAPGT